jgi:hypothetical protein
VDDDDRYQDVLSELGKLYASWQEFKAESVALIVEHRKTVNSAISSLAQEALNAQDDTKKRLEADATLRAARQTHTDRKDVALLSGLGCLIVVNALALLTLAIVLIAQNWR